jgi:hypothetical protein
MFRVEVLRFRVSGLAFRGWALLVSLETLEGTLVCFHCEFVVSVYGTHLSK